MFDIAMLRVDHRCVDASMENGASYEPCARRASFRAMVQFVRDMFPQGELDWNKTMTSGQFSEAFVQRLTAYFMDATHGDISQPDSTHANLFILLSGDTKRHENFMRIVKSGILRAQDITNVPGSEADEDHPTRTPIELQFQAMANAVIIEVLKLLEKAFAKYLKNAHKAKA